MNNILYREIINEDIEKYFPFIIKTASNIVNQRHIGIISENCVPSIMNIVISCIDCIEIFNDEQKEHIDQIINHIRK